MISASASCPTAGRQRCGSPSSCVTHHYGAFPPVAVLSVGPLDDSGGCITREAEPRPEAAGVYRRVCWYPVIVL